MGRGGVPKVRVAVALTWVERMPNLRHPVENCITTVISTAGPNIVYSDRDQGRADQSAWPSSFSTETDENKLFENKILTAAQQLSGIRHEFRQEAAE
jgi:hypothetical protein